MKRPIMSRRHVLWLATTALVAPLLVHGAEGFLIERGASAALASLPGLQHGPIHYDAAAGRVVISDLRGATSGFTMTLGRLSLPVPAGASLVGAARAQDDLVSLDDLRFKAGNDTLAIPHLDASGTNLEAADLKAIFDPSTALSPEQRLARLTAKRLAAAEVVISKPETTPGQPPDRLTFHDVILVDVVAGKIGKLDVGHADLASGKSDHPSSTLTSGAMSASELDLPLALAIGRGSRTDREMPLGTVYRSISIKDLKVSDTNSSMVFGTIASADARGRPPMRPFGELLRLANRAAGDRTDADKVVLAEALLDLAQSFSLGSFEIDGSSFKGEEKGPIDAAIDRIALKDLSVAKLASFSLDGFKLHTSDADMTLAHYGIEGSDQSGTLDTIASKMRDPGSMTGIAHFMPMMRPTLASMTMSMLHIDVPTKDKQGNSSDGSRILVDFPTATFTMAKRSGDGSTDTAAHAQMIFPMPPNPTSPGLRKAVEAGFHGFDVNFDYALNYNPRTEAIRLGQLSFDARDLVALKIGGSFGHIAPKLMDADFSTDASTEALQRITFENLSVELTNAGLIEKILPLLAASSHVSVPIFKAEMQGQAQAAVTQFLGTTPEAERINQAIASFMAKPKVFRLTLKAPDGLSMSDASAVDDPKDLLEKIDVDAVANP